MSKLSIGTWLTLPNESIAEIFATAGYDWVVVDLEHSAISINQAENLIRVIGLSGCIPYVRLSNHSSTQIKRVLDAGAAGIIAPMVESIDQGRKILDACYYPPSGKRGMGLARAQGYGNEKHRDSYIHNASKKIEVFFQIESIKSVDNINEIFSLPISGYFIGPYDLSASIGDPGNFNNKDFLIAEKKVLVEAEKRSIQKGFHLVEPSLKELDFLKKRGYNKIAFSVDIRMLDCMARLPFTT